ncbi:MAG: glycosyl hydrolase family 57, partial [Spirochaetaceae bacterium]
MKGTTDRKIHVAFRFHVNFYHSYRGDSLDERGIGKDIRIIRGILDDLDRLNAEGFPVRGTWDIENFFSLERMMRESAPELIERIQRRADPGDRQRPADEIEPMSYNNGIVSACTREEFALQMKLLRSNTERSGLDDLFSRWAPVVRPQECMYTPSFLDLYPEHGITAISLYYSAVPFNAFSTFVEPLAPEHRYNPVTLRSRSTSGSMTLIPCYNHGDIADNYLSLKRWLKRIRQYQRSMETPRDMLVVIDMDADDEFWVGIDTPVVARLL